MLAPRVDTAIVATVSISLLISAGLGLAHMGPGAQVLIALAMASALAFRNETTRELILEAAWSISALWFGLSMLPDIDADPESARDFYWIDGIYALTFVLLLGLLVIRNSKRQAADS